MANKESLKEQNTWIIVLFFMWCLTVYAMFAIMPADPWGKLQSTFKELNAKDGIIAALSPILALLLTGLISSDNKARLVFWRYNHALPGHRAFSQLIRKDPRIDINALKQKMGSLPKGPKEQNSQWYSIYKRYSEAPTVGHAHKQFLLSRDLCSISFLFTIVGPWGLLLSWHGIYQAAFYSAVMAVHYLLFMIVARNNGNRFVCNALAEYVTGKN